MGYGSESESDEDDEGARGGGGSLADYAPPGSMAPLLELGDALVYDQRTIHRGTANISSESRPLLYLLYKRPWYHETINFGEEPLFAHPAPHSASARGSGGKKKKKKRKGGGSRS